MNHDLHNRREWTVVFSWVAFHNSVSDAFTRNLEYRLFWRIRNVITVYFDIGKPIFLKVPLNFAGPQLLEKYHQQTHTLVLHSWQVFSQQLLLEYTYPLSIVSIWYTYLANSAVQEFEPFVSSVCWVVLSRNFNMHFVYLQVWFFCSYICSENCRSRCEDHHRHCLWCHPLFVSVPFTMYYVPYLKTKLPLSIIYIYTHLEILKQLERYSN